MNIQDVIEVLRDHINPADCSWELGWNEALKYAIAILELPAPVPRDYTPVFEAWKEAI